MLRQHDPTYGLVPFRLTDVPLDLRERAARALANRADLALPDEQTGLTGLLGALRTHVTAGGTSQKEAFERAAKRPSDKTYWIPRPAWERVMGS